MSLDPSSVPNSEDPYPNDIVRKYDLISTKMGDDPGTLSLSRSFAAYAGLSGHMELKFVGKARDFGETEISNANIYRVVNADTFYRENKWPNGLCYQKFSFLGIRRLPNFAQEPSRGHDAIRVTAVVQNEFKNVTPGSVCSGQSYVLHQQSESESK